MYLVAGPVPGFLEFIQILGWISLPIVGLAVLFAVIMHYRRKRREAVRVKKDEEAFITANPELVGYTRGDGEYVLFDHSTLIHEYKKKLTYNHARYTALQHDYVALEAKFEALALYAGAVTDHPKTETMETPENTVATVLQEVDEVAARHAAEKKELVTKIEQLTRSHQALELEKEKWLQQLVTDNGNDVQKQEVFDKWKEENSQLKNRIAEQECLKDILEEKNAQIGFLQSQLELRIKNQYQSEQSRLHAESEMKEQSVSYQHSVDELQQQLLTSRDEADRLQVAILAKEEQITDRQQILAGKLDQITLLENNLREVRKQNEMLQAESADVQDRLRNVEQQYADEQERVQYLTQQLHTARQNLRRIYKEVAACVGEEESPVISLRPGYLAEAQE